MENLHMINVKYLGPTNTKGSRIKLTSLRFEDSVTIPYDYQFNNSLDVAVDYLQSKQVAVIGTGETPTGYIIAIKAFEPMSNIKIGGVCN